MSTVSALPAIDRTVHVLLVEDNPADVDLTRETFGLLPPRVTLHLAADGAEAIDFLRQRGRHVHAPRPDLVLLDLNLPGIDGREVLGNAKNDRDLRRIPIVVLTSSEAESDVLKSYDLGANCYLTKPLELTTFQSMVRSLEDFWLAVARLPPR
jgi:two-component system, chemotaxis family, response regulator Rcp1